MSCFLCASKLRGMADMLEEKKSSSTSFGALAAAVSSSTISDFDLRDVLPPRTFLDARSEQVSSVDLETLDVADPKKLTTLRQKLLEIGIDVNVWSGNTMV